MDEAQQLHDLIRRFRIEMDKAHHLDRLVGQSAAMNRVARQVKMAAAATGSVLMVGPPGIGRQHMARTIHSMQPQPGGALVPVACAALPADVLQSAISSIVTRHSRPEAGPPATLLLTDIDSLPAEIQVELVQRLAGGLRNIRLIGTAKQLLTGLKGFRSDLAHRLSTLVIELPPLEERREDIPLITQLLLEDSNGQRDTQLRGFAPAALDRLTLHDWPGQIDELAAVVREACALAEGFEVTPADLPKRFHQAAEAARFGRQPPQPIDLEEFLADVETKLIERALRLAKDNKTQAARLLGLNRPKLYRRMVQLGLESEDETLDDD